MDAQAPRPVTLHRFVHGVALGLGGAWEVAHALGVVEPHGEHVTLREAFQPHFGSGPAQRARHTAQVDLVVRFFFASHWPTPKPSWYSV